MVKWEYNTLDIIYTFKTRKWTYEIGDKTFEGYNKGLNALGQEGWELVSSMVSDDNYKITTSHTFKRPLP